MRWGPPACSLDAYIWRLPCTVAALAEHGIGTGTNRCFHASQQARQAICLALVSSPPAAPSSLQFASLIALLLAWVFIFDTVSKERELLEGPKEGIVGASGVQVRSLLPLCSSHEESHALPVLQRSQLGVAAMMI